MKFTFNQKWQDLFGDEINAVKDKIKNNKYASYNYDQSAQDYQFSKLPSLKYRWVHKLIAIRDNDVRSLKDLLKITDPDKLDIERWGNGVFAYLSKAGFIEKKDGKYVLTVLGNAVVDYAESHK